MAAAASAEQAALNNAIAETNGSPIDFIRALEKHLEKYPASPQRAAIEDTIVKTAIEANENRWIAAYGEKTLARQVSPELQLLDRVARALLDTETPDAGVRALAVARRYENTIMEMAARHPEGHLTDGQWALEVEKGLSRAYSLQAHALGNMGKPDEAAAMARKAWDHWPTGEAAREAAHWLDKQNKTDDAIVWYANAFAIDDPKTTTEQRAKDRARLGELYGKVHGSDKGLAELLLTSYDNAAAGRTARIRAQKAKDPNIEAAALEDFQLQAVQGAPLPVKSLLGKTVVLDFWATWCVPCVAQHPMIEHVKKKFADNKDVVFLALNADDDRSLVPAFIREQKWEGPLYYEGGLAKLMNIGSLPTLLILDGRGQVTSRMAGYIPEKFESMLEQRILDTREPQSK
jgi:thiol-disulfide isomerase/thioredoxin